MADELANMLIEKVKQEIQICIEWDQWKCKSNEESIAMYHYFLNQGLTYSLFDLEQALMRDRQVSNKMSEVAGAMSDKIKRITSEVRETVYFAVEFLMSEGASSPAPVDQLYIKRIAHEVMMKRTENCIFKIPHNWQPNIVKGKM